MRRLMVLLAVSAALLRAATVPLTAQEPEPPTAIITAPADGQQLFGAENISGSAYHASAFDHYTLEYDDLSDAEARWLLVQPVVRQQVRDGVLGAWNTTFVPDGVYRLRLRVFTTDGQEAEHVVSNLRVANAAPTPVPTRIPAAAPAVPTPGPSPTSPIEQPPSSNPSLDVAANPAPFEEGSSPVLAEPAPRRAARLNLDRIRGAFCTGAYLTLAGFGLMLAYAVLRGRRPRAPRANDWPGEA